MCFSAQLVIITGITKPLKAEHGQRDEDLNRSCLSMVSNQNTSVGNNQNRLPRSRVVPRGLPFLSLLDAHPAPPPTWVSAGQVSKLSRCPTQECQVSLLSSKCSPIIQGIASPHREKRGSPLFLSTTLLPKFTSFLFPVFHLNAARPREKWVKASR